MSVDGAVLVEAAVGQETAKIGASVMHFETEDDFAAYMHGQHAHEVLHGFAADNHGKMDRIARRTFQYRQANMKRRQAERELRKEFGVVGFLGWIVIGAQVLQLIMMAINALFPKQT